MRISVGDIELNTAQDGSPDGAPIVFANSLGTDLRVWDKLIPLLPEGLRIIRFDKRGHGQSDVPTAPYTMGQLITDTERLLDALNVRECVFVGLSIGGLIAQGLAVKRVDQMRAMVLSNTAFKFGTPQMWNDRIDAIRAGGLEPQADGIMERWFSKSFREGPELQYYRDMLTSQPVEGYVGCCAAIAGADFFTPTSGLGLPTLGIAGSEDGASPPDLVRETTGLVKGSKFHMIRGAGHIPCVENPQEYAATLTKFLKEIGHV